MYIYFAIFTNRNKKIKNTNKLFCFLYFLFNFFIDWVLFENIKYKK